MHHIIGLLATFIVIATGYNDLSKYPETLAELYLINENKMYYFTFNTTEYQSKKKNAVALSVALGKSEKCKELFPIFHMKSREPKKRPLYTMDLNELTKWSSKGYDIAGNIGYGAKTLGYCGANIVVVQTLIPILKDHYFLIRNPRTIMELDSLVNRKINNALMYGRNNHARFKREKKLPPEINGKHLGAPTKSSKTRHRREIASWELRMQAHLEMLMPVSSTD